MKKISSKLTFLYKRIYPVLIFASFLVPMTIFILEVLKGKAFFIPFLLILGGCGVYGYFIVKKLFIGLFDEVYDAGEYLLFVNGTTKKKVEIKDIKNISYHSIGRPARVTVSLRDEKKYGKELTFCALESLLPFAKRKEITDIIGRIDKLRG